MTTYDILYKILSNLSYWKPKLLSVSLSDDEKMVDVTFRSYIDFEDKQIVPFDISFTLYYELFDNLDMLKLNDELGYEVVPRTEYP